MDFTESQCSRLLDIARSVIQQQLGRRDLPRVPEDEPAFAQSASCFVTLHSLGEHHLRGCIGQINATGPLLESVKSMAEAVLDDPRFRVNPVTLAELPDLEMEITVLSPLEKAANPLDFELLQHGIYLHCRGETGCFLPQVARETGWTKEQLLARLCTEKMGLAADSWRSPDARLYRFSATIIGPERFVR